MPGKPRTCRQTMKTLAAMVLIALAISPVLQRSAWSAPPGAKNTGSYIRQPAGKRRALLIGINNYYDPRLTDLEYPLNDVSAFSELLSSPVYGFTVTRLTDETPLKPTRENILAAIKKHLIDDAREGDILLFYYSGHGSSIKNSLSDEPDLRDETIVPADAVRPIANASQLKDIRDKELAELFNLSLGKRASLTTIFDSCHSGSIARGEERTKEVDGAEFDIRSPVTEPQRIKPEDRGALVLTAAEDYQRASGATYELAGRTAKFSHFTIGLLRSLYDSPGDRASSRDIFRNVVARLVAEGRTQTPTIAATSERLDRTLFGGETRESSGRARIPVTIKVENRVRRVLLAGGLADGLTDGTELVRIDPATGAEPAPALRIRIKKAGLTLSEFEVVRASGPPSPASAADGLKGGEVFEQRTWFTAKDPHLRVFIPPALSEAELRSLVDGLANDKGENHAEIADEPTSEGVAGIIFPQQRGESLEWFLNAAAGETRLGATPDLRLAAGSLGFREGPAKPRFFLNLPPSPALRVALQNGLAQSGVEITADRGSANYELAGRFDPRTRELEYAWVLCSAFTEGPRKNGPASAAFPVSLPLATDWVGAAGGAAAAELRTLAQRLGKIRGWLRLSSPIEVGSLRFPYRMEIRERKAVPLRRLKPGDILYEGKEYALVLAASRRDLSQNPDLMAEFWVYVLNIDSDGNGRLVSESGASEKYGGYRNFDLLDPPAEIPLLDGDDDALIVFPPFGTESFILLITDRPIDKSVLNFQGVRNRELAARGEFSPLERLLERVGADTRSKSGTSTPDTWGVQQLILRSTSAEK